MNRIERLLVHVEEAFRLEAFDDDAHLRLALLLFDSAAELMLHRESQYRLSWHNSDRRELDNLLRHEARAGSLHESLERRKQCLEERLPSKTAVGKIYREFDAKAEFLAGLDVFPGSIARALSKLHRYRNEAYHRDRLRPSTLRTAVSLYGFVVCELMRRIPVHGYVWLDPPPPLLAKYLEVGHDEFGALGRAADDFEQQARFGGAIAPFLSDHVVERLDDIDEMLAYAANFISEVQNDRDWDVDAILHSIQAENPLSFEVAFATPSQLRAMQVPHTLVSLGAWRATAQRLADVEDPIEAFGRFADLEDEFEDLESGVQDLVRSIDDEINLQVDIARGN